MSCFSKLLMMNPNLAIFLRRALIAMALIGCGGVLFLLFGYLQVDLNMLFDWVAKGFFGLLIAGMMILIIGVVVRELWTNIMRRSETIKFICEDASEKGIHIIGSHYFSGGDTGDGYSSFHHYFLRLDGKIFLSKKVDDEKDLSRSLKDLSDQLKFQLSPRKENSTEIGYYKNDDKLFEKEMKLRNGKIVVKSFENWIDYGFAVAYLDNQGKRKWRRVI
jgi:hypothetical protein